MTFEERQEDNLIWKFKGTDFYAQYHVYPLHSNVLDHPNDIDFKRFLNVQVISKFTLTNVIYLPFKLQNVPIKIWKCLPPT
jgi:hypothetical protein